MITKIILKSLMNNEDYVFIFPSELSTAVVVDHVKYIRFGSQSNWERKLREHTLLPFEQATEFKDLATEEMKYIVHGNNENGQECLIAFSKNIDHDRAHEMLMDMHFGGEASDDIDVNKPYSAGFIHPSGVCHGRSETMNMESRKTDTDLAKSGMLK